MYDLHLDETEMLTTEGEFTRLDYQKFMEGAEK